MTGLYEDLRSIDRQAGLGAGGAVVTLVVLAVAALTGRLS
jgi:hypothetical protein